jgi:hypothetical protein
MSQDQQSTHWHEKGFKQYLKQKHAPLFTSELLDGVEREIGLCDVPKSPKKADFNGTKLWTTCTT